MACARPIVASDIGAVREITNNSGCALLVSPDKPDELAEGVKILIEDKKLRKEMGKRGRKYVVEHFDRRKITAKLMNELFDNSANYYKRLYC
jgi:glycosyltransferase involved in cell wall biosynthesis